MPLITNVFRRGGSYCFRVAVPKDLRARIGRRELWRSLKTSDPSIAKARAGTLMALTQNLWRDLQQAMTTDEMKALIDGWTIAQLERDEDARRSLSGSDLAIHDEEQRTLFGSASLRRSDAYFDSSLAEAHLDQLAADSDVALSPRERDRAVQMVMAAHFEIFKATTLRMSLGWRPIFSKDPAQAILDQLTPAPVGERPSRFAQAAVVTVGKLSLVSREAIRALSAKDAWRPKRVADYEAAVETFIFAFGRDPDLGEITADIAGRYMRQLSSYPSNVKKKKDFREIPTFEGRLEAVERLGHKDVLEATTVNTKYLTPLRRIWAWKREERSQLPNPFAEISASKPRRPDPRNARRIFSETEVARLFRLPLFIGSAGTAGSPLYQPGDVKVDDWRFWVPLICFFSGMRLNEACGLGVSDIKVDSGGVHYFHVRDELEGQSLKTASSRRKVPIHRALIAIGFVEFVARQGTIGRQRLFEELKGDAQGYFSGSPSKFFSRLIKSIVDDDPDEVGKLVFHSIRHTVITKLRSGEVRLDFSKEIVGHEQGDVHGAYGIFALAEVRDAVNTIEYRDLDVAKLAR